jgi:hypothetical protein
MTVDAKRRTLALLLLTIGAAVLIAMGLPYLKFQPSAPLPELQKTTEKLTPESVPAITFSVSATAQMITAIVLLAAAAFAGFKFRKKIPWREILIPSISIAVLALIGLIIRFALQGVHLGFSGRPPEILPQVNFESPSLGPVNPNWIWLVWIGLAIGMISIGVWFLFWSAGRSRTEDPLKREAELAIHALRTGSDIRNVIVRCYLQMSQALQKEQGITREETMTARDFERLLEARGIPHDPIHQLTRLFEGARYGHRPPGPEDERTAFECLSAIVQSSRATKPPA